MVRVSVVFIGPAGDILTCRKAAPRVILVLPDVEALSFQYTTLEHGEDHIAWWAQVFEQMPVASYTSTITLNIQPTLSSLYEDPKWPERVPECWKRLDAALCQPKFANLRLVTVTPEAYRYGSQYLKTLTRWIARDCLVGLRGQRKVVIDWETYPDRLHQAPRVVV